MNYEEGLFIAIEGMDGCGKSTQIDFLKDFFKGNENILFLREPGSTQLGEKIRNLIIEKDSNSRPMEKDTEALLFAAARNELWSKKILPALAKGKCVICDRYIDSSIAYQGFGKENLKNVLAYNKKVLQRVPDYTFYIETSKEAIEERNTEKTLDRLELELEETEYQSRVREGYKFLIEQDITNPHIVINGDLTAEEVFKQIKNVILVLLQEREIYYEKEKSR